MPHQPHLTSKQPDYWSRRPMSELARIIVSLPANPVSPQEGDVLLRMDQAQDRIQAWVFDPAQHDAPTHHALLRPTGAMLPQALAWWLSSPSCERLARQLVARMGGIGSQRWSQLSELILAVPSLEEQRKLLDDRASSVALLRRHIADQRRLLETMERLAISMDQTLLSTELGVDEARGMLREMFGHMRKLQDAPGKPSGPKIG